MKQSEVLFFLSFGTPILSVKFGEKYMIVVLKDSIFIYDEKFQKLEMRHTGENTLGKFWIYPYLYNIICAYIYNMYIE